MPVQFDLLTCSTSVGDLHGIFSSPPGGSDRLAVHIHGTWGNFYANPFIVPLAEMYNAKGWSFLSANFPGHDETAIAERFEDFQPALEAWLHLVPQRSLILQGHSLGALKILSAASSPKWSSLGVIGAVLLSPFDVAHFYEAHTHMSRSELRDYALRHGRDQGIDTPLPRSVFDLWPISAAVIEAVTEEGSKWDAFPSARGDVSSLSALGIPALLAIGSEDFASSPDPAEVVRLTGDKAGVSASLVPGAPHNFAGAVPELVTLVERWLTGLTY